MQAKKVIKKHLQDHYNLGKLHNSYLINSDAIDIALEEIKNFIKENILTIGELNTNPDYVYIEKLSTAKHIAIDQVRSLLNFLSKTSVLSEKKVAIIYAADKMNINAANCCLKILEEAGGNTYLFLLTDNISSILPTIASRCMKINCSYKKPHSTINERFITPLLKSTPIADRLSFINEFSKKDRDLWDEFSYSLQIILMKFCHKTLRKNIVLSKIEEKLFNEIQPNSSEYIQRKYERIINIINYVNKFDLDLQMNCVLIIEEF